MNNKQILYIMVIIVMLYVLYILYKRATSSIPFQSGQSQQGSTQQKPVVTQHKSVNPCDDLTDPSNWLTCDIPIDSNTLGSLFI